MPTYKVGDMHIKFNGKVYAPGDEIELTRAEAAKLGKNVKLAKGEEKEAKKPDKSAELPSPDEEASAGGDPPKSKKGFFRRE